MRINLRKGIKNIVTITTVLSLIIMSGCAKAYVPVMTDDADTFQTSDTSIENDSDEKTVDEAATEKIKEDTVKDMLNEMTLRDKVGQMIMVAIRQWTDTPEDPDSYSPSIELSEGQIKAISENNLCGVCLFASNIVDTKQTVKLTTQIQEAAFSSGYPSGALISIDQEGGYVTRLATGTSGIGNMAIAATQNPENARIEAEIIGEELSALGIDLDFAPDADVNNNPDNPIIGIRSFSDDPIEVSKNVAKFLKGLSEKGVIGCLKHFPGHGDTDTDSHTGLPLIDKTYDEIKKNELIPFADNCADADMIMTAHIQFPKIEDATYTSTSGGEEVFIPATMSKKIITDVLRKDLGFDGVVVTDALEMEAISANFELNDVARMAINSDVDILLMPFDITDMNKVEELNALIDSIVEMVERGEIAESEINDSVERIWRLKEKRGLLVKDGTSVEEKVENALTIVGNKEHHDKEWEMALEAVTVYKNDDALPLSPEEKSSILYLSATNGQLLSTEYAKAKLAEEGESTDDTVITGLSYDGIEFEDVKELISSANVVIITTSTGALNQTDITNPENKKAILCHNIIEEAHKQDKKVIVISTQLPYDADAYSIADAVLLCYNPAGITELPTEYNGNVKKFGPNVPAAIYSVIK